MPNVMLLSWNLDFLVNVFCQVVQCELSRLFTIEQIFSTAYSLLKCVNMVTHNRSMLYKCVYMCCV